MNYSIVIKRMTDFEPTGEFRVPNPNESYLSPFGLVTSSMMPMHEQSTRIILRRIISKDVPPDGYYILTKDQIGNTIRENDALVWAGGKWRHTNAKYWLHGYHYSVKIGTVLRTKQSGDVPPDGHRIVKAIDMETTRKPANAAYWHAGLGRWEPCALMPNNGVWSGNHTYAVPACQTLDRIVSESVPPVSYRIVTDEEKADCIRPNTGVLLWSCDGCWKPAYCSIWADKTSYAIQISAKLDMNAIEMTMAEVERTIGCKVKIVK